MDNLPRLVLVAVVSGAFATTPSHAQARAAVALGGTWLDFGSPWGDLPAFTAQGRVARPLSARVSGELSLLTVVPLGSFSAIPDCLAGASCFEYQTPNMLVGLVASVDMAGASPALQVTVGVGRLEAIGMKGPGHRSSRVGSIGLEWALRRRGLTPTIGMRAIGLAPSVAGMRYLILPAVGVLF